MSVTTMLSTLYFLFFLILRLTINNTNFTHNAVRYGGSGVTFFGAVLDISGKCLRRYN